MYGRISNKHKWHRIKFKKTTTTTNTIAGTKKLVKIVNTKGPWCTYTPPTQPFTQFEDMLLPSIKKDLCKHCAKINNYADYHEKNYLNMV